MGRGSSSIRATPAASAKSHAPRPVTTVVPQVARDDYPTFMRKTSVYLTERESKRLAELARSEGRSQAEIIRDAIPAYVPAGGSA